MPWCVTFSIHCDDFCGRWWRIIFFPLFSVFSFLKLLFVRCWNFCIFPSTYLLFKKKKSLISILLFFCSTLGEHLNLYYLLTLLWIFLNKFIRLFYYLFLAALGLCCCVRLSLVAVSGGLHFIAVRGLLIGWLL